MFGLLRTWRRRSLRRRPLPESWTGILYERVPFYRRFEQELRQRFLERCKIFVWEKVWIAAGGMEIDEEVKVVIAAAAVRLALHLDEGVYDRLTEIVVYPSHYHHPEEEDIVFGEAHHWGTVVLSWDAVLHGLENPSDGHDTATHEFAHVLDRNEGHFNGAPELRAREDYRPWAKALGHHYERLREGRRTERRLLRDYGATNEAEFFAVATETFFEKGRRMRDETPELYEQLKHYYGFDPAEEEERR